MESDLPINIQSEASLKQMSVSVKHDVLNRVYLAVGRS